MLPFANVVDSRRLDNNGFEFIWQTLSTEELQRPVPVVIIELTERLTVPTNTHIITYSTRQSTQLVSHLAVGFKYGTSKYTYYH